MDLKTKRTELQSLVNQAKSEYARLESEYVKKSAEVPAEEAEKLNRLIADGEAKRAELEQLEKLEKMDDFANRPERDAKAGGRRGARAETKSWGEIIVGSQEFKANDRRRMEPVQVKAIFNDTDANGGYLVREQRVVEVFDIARQRDRTVLDLVNQSQTTADAVEYVVLSARTNNSAVVPERSGGNFGLKPEGDLTFDLKTAPVKTIAQWVAASRQILSDAPRLRDTVDNELAYMLEIELEEQIVSGDGTGNNFTGILNTSGIQSRVHQSSGRDFSASDTIADTLRRALTDIRLEFYRPDGIALNPIQAEALELTKDTTGQYVNVYDPVQMRLWRVPVVEADAVADGTAIVGAWRLGATLWDRMDTEIRVGEPNDYFLRNAVAVLAELRAAFGVTRPKAFEKVSGF